MYKVDTPTNSLHSLQEVSFSSLGFRERDHLQEWLAKNPQALTRDNDDELLIIQKEFAGFDDTKERLDLLALDKKGNLVIIENKLDDSGRDVVWQALKYAGYCANLRQESVVEIFQLYLDQYEPNENRQAAEVIAEFMGWESLKEGVLNRKGTQRVIMVAANFRKEVTNTALWLMQFGIRAATYPFIADDMDNLVLPAALKPLQHKLFGLTINPERLAAIREERRENSRYASMRQCRMEVSEVEALYRKNQIPWLNSTNYSVEEIATKILDIMGLNRRMY